MCNIVSNPIRLKQTIFIEIVKMQHVVLKGIMWNLKSKKMAALGGVCPVFKRLKVKETKSEHPLYK